MIDTPLSPEIEANLRLLRAMRDEDIDFSDIPEETDFSGYRRVSDIRPADEPATVPVDPELVQWFRTHGDTREDWRVRINQALREHIALAEQKAA